MLFQGKLLVSTVQVIKYTKDNAYLKTDDTILLAAFKMQSTISFPGAFPDWMTRFCVCYETAPQGLKTPEKVPQK